MRIRWTRFAALFAVLATAFPAWAGEPRHYPRGAEAPPPPPRHSLEQGQFRLWLGSFEPRGSSDFWREDLSVFTGSTSDLRDVNYGGDALWSVNPNVSLIFSLSYYQGTVNQYYRPLADGFVPTTDQGRALTSVGHTSRLEITPLTVGFLFYPAGRKAPIIPYVGLGGGLYWWRWREAGDYCNGTTDPCTEFSDAYSSDGVVPGYFFVGGLDVPVRPTWSVFFEARVQRATATVSTDVALNGAGRLDVGGTQYEAGIAWRF